MSQIRVLFVCTGNICRSPTAEGVLRYHVEQAGVGDQILVDSAGTIDYHAGEPPDPRMQAAARRRNYDLSRLRARQVEPTDFARFDYLLAMDQDHVSWLKRQAPGDHAHKIQLFLEYAPEIGPREVPDPYYGGTEGFEVVLDLIERASVGLFAELQRELARRRAR
jgi:protein-tyrosine phosphatase